MSETQTSLAKPRGLTRHKQSGAQHWRGQRLSALILAPLMLWFVFSALGLVGADHYTFVTWLSSPVNASLMVLLVATLFFHSQQGMKVIIEDYIHDAALRLAALVVLKVFACIGVLSSLLAIFLIAI